MTNPAGDGHAAAAAAVEEDGGAALLPAAGGRDERIWRWQKRREGRLMQRALLAWWRHAMGELGFGELRSEGDDDEGAGFQPGPAVLCLV